MKAINLLLLMLLSSGAFAQFHTLKMPRTSQPVTETQTLGVTDITIAYSSPAVNNRDVWNNADIIPQNADPIPWRAGANMATTMTFSTDVKIEGQPLKAGTYGFHVIPENDSYTLLFAHAYNQWGSYYLDLKKDISLKVAVKAETCAASEQLDFEFLDRSENALTIGLEWGEQRIPFRVAVDLNQTVTESFRNELRGINTYHWQAWNDAALWCLEHDTNLEEALEWSNRSIAGGFNGFAANKNVRNMVTKLRILQRTGMEEAFAQTLKEAMELQVDLPDARFLTRALLALRKNEEAFTYANKQYRSLAKAWPLLLDRGLTYYALGKPGKAVKDIERVKTLAPKNLEGQLDQIAAEFESGAFKIRTY